MVGLVSKEIVVSRRRRSKARKCGIKQDDKGQITTLKRRGGRFER